MITVSFFTLFVPTFIFVSITPGMCMTLAMSMGMSIGLKRTYYMFIGELVGVGLIVLISALGMAQVMLEYPLVFSVFKLLGGCYLMYLAMGLWLSKGRLAFSETAQSYQNIARWDLILQGFVTAIANPKGWAFFISLLPPFIDQEAPLMQQIIIMLVAILVIELLSLTLYASGGHTIKKLLSKKGNVKLVNRIAGCLMAFVAVWLAFG